MKKLFKTILSLTLMVASMFNNIICSAYDYYEGSEGELQWRTINIETTGFHTAIDEICGVERDGNKAKGIPYRNGNNMYSAFNDLTFNIHRVSYKKAYVNIAKGSYSDVPDDAWYLEYIVWPTYFGVINGYSDGTLRANNYVTFAELAKIVSMAFNADIKPGGSLHNVDFDGKWYNNYLNAILNAFPYHQSRAMEPVYMDSPVRRCEVAYVLASIINTEKDMRRYYDKLRAKDFGSMSQFTDFVNAQLYTYGGGYSLTDFRNEQRVMKEQEPKLPDRFATAMMLAHDKGVFEGDGNGKIRPFDYVTRAELLKLITKVCELASEDKVYELHGGERSYRDRVADIPYDERSNDGEYLDGSGKFTSVNWCLLDTRVPGDTGSMTDYGLLREEWIDRKNIKVYWNQKTRPRLKAGDIFVAEDGTEYLLENSEYLMPEGDPVVGVGLPIATDLGREYIVFGRTEKVENKKRVNSIAFGPISTEYNCLNDSGGYIVFEETGEGHWDHEWNAIAKATRPTVPGVDGQISSDRYWVYRDSEYDALDGWEFRVR